MYEENKWVIYDGDGSKPSTNGTWLFADCYVEVQYDMIFKAAQTMFRTTIVNK